MSNRMLARYINTFKDTRQEWIDILVKNPDSHDAPRYIMSINAKIELLRTLWNFNEEGKMP